MVLFEICFLEESFISVVLCSKEQTNLSFCSVSFLYKERNIGQVEVISVQFSVKT